MESFLKFIITAFAYVVVYSAAAVVNTYVGVLILNKLNWLPI